MILTNSELNEVIKELDGWKIVDNQLLKEFKFKGFIQAFGFMTEVAITAESMDHHPEWSNVYNRVVINLSTHSEGGITLLDKELAMKIDRINHSMQSLNYII